MTIKIISYLEVVSSGVDVDGLAEDDRGHGAALYVPAGSAKAPRRLPRGLTGLQVRKK